MAYYLHQLKAPDLGRVAFHKSFILRSSCCILQRAKESSKSDRNNVENHNGSKDISTCGRPGNDLSDTLPRPAPCRSTVGIGNQGSKRDSGGRLEGLRRVGAVYQRLSRRTLSQPSLCRDRGPLPRRVVALAATE